MIYRELLTVNSPMIPQGRRRKTLDMGYCSFGFRWQILATNRQIYDEARQIFYGDNDWTFFVSPAIPFKALAFTLSPLKTGLPLLRKINIRFRLFDVLVWHCAGGEDDHNLRKIQDSVNEICKVLDKARSLLNVKLIWTEQSGLWGDFRSYSYITPYGDWAMATPVDGVNKKAQSLIAQILQPLAQLQCPCPLQKSAIMVLFRGGLQAEGAEAAFHSAVDALIAYRASNTTSTFVPSGT